ncbi:MAG: hypothetical protein KDD14_08525 [Saprospiraceae bacterium]|nr:hypothetical protein [Saprospiraceae bacterium]
MAHYRYPGAQPFSTAQESIFFGRGRDIEAFYRQIRLESLVVLHAKSGLGKSSLLQAGIIPRVLEDGKYRPVHIRFKAYNPKGETVLMPLEVARAAVRAASESRTKDTFLEKLLPMGSSLWYLMKREQVSNNNQRQFLLFFDQFEELFTYPPEFIRQFKVELAELLNTQIPQRYLDMVEQEVEQPELLSAEQLTLVHQPFEAKIVLAIRSDRVSMLDRLADYLPQVKRSWYELDALSLEQAEEAILNPAYKQGKFASPVFDYSDEALEAMLSFLTRGGTQKIESFQLQILCQAIERKVIRQKLKQVGAAELGNIEEVYANYYEDQLRQISDPRAQNAARRFLEEGLIFEEEERRLSLYEGQIFRQFGVTEALLRQLEDTHLIRREPSIKGGFTYELSHDTLVVPVLNAKQKRMAAQQLQDQWEEQQQRALELYRERRKRQLSNWIAAAGFVLAAFAIGAWIYALNQKNKADSALETAEQARQAAVDALQIARQEKAQRDMLDFTNMERKIKVFMDADEPGLAEEEFRKMELIVKSDSLGLNPGLPERLEEVAKRLGQYQNNLQ